MILFSDITQFNTCDTVHNIFKIDLFYRKLEFEDRTSALDKVNANLKYSLHKIEERTTENASREAIRELDRENLGELWM